MSAAVAGTARRFRPTASHTTLRDVTVLKLLYFEEHIHVYVADQELKTDHSFALGGRRFLTLRYDIQRLAVAPR